MIFTSSSNKVHTHLRLDISRFISNCFYFGHYWNQDGERMNWLWTIKLKFETFLAKVYSTHTTDGHLDALLSITFIYLRICAVWSGWNSRNSHQSFLLRLQYFNSLLSPWMFPLGASELPTISNKLQWCLNPWMSHLLSREF